MDTSDNLMKKVFSWLDLQKKGAEKMNQLASELENHKENVKISQVVGGSVSVGGAAAITVAGILTFCTGGAAFPLLLTGGAVASGLGVATNVGSTIVEEIISSLSMKEAKQIGENIENAFKEITDSLHDEWQDIQTEDGLPFDSPLEYVEEQILRVMAKDHGLKINGHIKLSNMLKALQDIVGHQVSARHSDLLSGLLSEFFLRVIPTEVLKNVIQGLGKATAAAGAKTIASGTIGLLFSVPDLIMNSISLAKKNFVTKASRSLRDAATTMLNSSEQMRKELNEIRKLLEVLCDLKNIIENQKRNDNEKKALMRFAIKYFQEETTQQWLRENSESFSKLVDMFSFLQKQIDDEEKKNHNNKVDITFLSHGSIEDQMIPAKFLLPLDSIHDVVLYSPWNCLLSVDAAYDIATGNMEPQDSVFYCCSKDCKVPSTMHQPTKLPDEWNSMKKAGDKKIPNIMLSPVRLPEDGAWKRFEELKDEYGKPGRNHILIPFIIPGMEEDEIPFFVVSLALSLVLMFSRFQATLHLTACLGKARENMKLDEDALKKQYRYTMDNTGMASSAKRSRTNEELYTKLQALFGDRSSGC